MNSRLWIQLIILERLFQFLALSKVRKIISFVSIWITLENLIKELKQRWKWTQCTVDVYTLQGYEEWVKNHAEELWEIKWGLLPLEDTNNLEERGTTLEQLLSSLSVSTKLLDGSKGETPKKSERNDWQRNGNVAAWKRSVDFPRKYDQVENLLGAIWEQHTQQAPIDWHWQVGILERCTQGLSCKETQSLGWHRHRRFIVKH